MFREHHAYQADEDVDDEAYDGDEEDEKVDYEGDDEDWWGRHYRSRYKIKFRYYYSVCQYNGGKTI